MQVLLSCGHSVPLVSVLRKFVHNTEVSVLWTLCPFGVCIKEV